MGAWITLNLFQSFHSSNEDDTLPQKSLNEAREVNINLGPQGIYLKVTLNNPR